MPAAAPLRARDLTVTRGPLVVLDGVDLVVAAGERDRARRPERRRQVDAAAGARRPRAARARPRRAHPADGDRRLPAPGAVALGDETVADVPRPPHRRHRRATPSSTRPRRRLAAGDARRRRPLRRRPRPLAGARRRRPRGPRRRGVGRPRPHQPAARPADGVAVGRRGGAGRAGRAAAGRASTCSCSTSRPTTSTSTGSIASSAGSASCRPPSCSSATTARSSPAPSPTWSRSTSSPTAPRAYGGGWQAYLDERDAARRHAWERFEEYDTQAAVAGRAGAARAGVGAAGPGQGQAVGDDEPDKNIRAFRINQTEQLAGEAARTERAIERLDVVDKPREPWQLRLDGGRRRPQRRRRRPPRRRRRSSGGDFTLGPIDLLVGAGERVALVGANGSGKTTLLDALLGRVEPPPGAATLGPSVVVGEIEQARDQLAGRDDRCCAAFQDATGLDVVRGPHAARQVRPRRRPRRRGRRPRCRRASARGPSLALLMANGANLLVLDEPTNHLDLPAIEQLEAGARRRSTAPCCSSPTTVRCSNGCASPAASSSPTARSSATHRPDRLSARWRASVGGRLWPGRRASPGRRRRVDGSGGRTRRRPRAGAIAGPPW